MTFKLLPLLIVSKFGIMVLFCLSLNANAQSEKEIKEIMVKLDTSAFKGKVFLNKAFFVKSLIEPLRSKDKNENGTSILNLTPKYFEFLTTIVADADLNDKPKPKNITAIQQRTRKELTASNIIPIGIINADAVLLTTAQVQNNINAKNENKTVNTTDYENIEIITAGLMQSEIFQGNVVFQLSPTLVQANINNPIKKLEIDFQDGKGWQAYDFKEQLIAHQFSTVGEVAISLKLITERGTYITYAPLKIRQLERPQAFFTSTVTATKLIQEPTKGGRLMSNVSGAEYAIYNGCDNVFDKPIIIAEGFDVGQDVDISDLVAKYYPYLYAFRNNGYDLVFVNYDDGRDYMQNNAQVLKNVINQVNAMKIGNEALTIVGESMSGLVARWALREMENQGQTHHVGHFISFDSPHQGANVPPGLVALRRDLTGLTGWVSVLLNMFVPEVRAIDTPAAKQLLLYQSNTLGKDPLFDSFRQDLANLGNGGYPNQGGIRNIALLDGNIFGAYNSNFTGNTLNPGDKILDVDIVGILCNAFIDVWTNQVGQNTQVYSGDAFGICNIANFTRRNVNLPYNFDRLAGGYIANGLGYGFPIYSTTNPSFSFVPTFSSIDYRGNRNSDSDYTLSIWNNIVNSNYQVTNTSLTPFVAIYGNTFSNTSHSFSGGGFPNITSAWNDIAINEYNIPNPEDVLAIGCSLPLPSAVMQTHIQFKSGWVTNTLPASICKYTAFWKVPARENSIILFVQGNTTSNYVQFIRISGNGITPIRLNLDQLNHATFNYGSLSVGTYTVESVRQFYSGSTNTYAGEVSTSSTLQIRGNCRVGVTCPDNTEIGEVIATLAETNETIYANKLNNVWFGTLEDGTIISRKRLIANGMNANGAMCFAEGCITVQSGDWDNPTTWLSGYVPTAREDIWVKSGHHVMLTPAMGIQTVRSSCVEYGSVFDCTGTLLMDAH